MAKMIYTLPFLEDLSRLDERVAGHIWEKLALVEPFPGVGSALVEPSLARAFGQAILKVTAAGYDILYQRDYNEEQENEIVVVLGIVPQRAVR